jgi:putative addiction module CopG family antidote
MVALRYHGTMPNPITVTLHPDQEQYLASRLQAGQYGSADEAVNEALRLMELQEQDRHAAFEEVRAKIASGLAQARRGELLDGEQVFEELRARLNANSAS